MNFKLTTLCLSLTGIMGANCLFAQATASTGSVTTTATAPVATETEVKPPPLSISGQVDAYYRFSSAKAAGLTSYTPATNAFGLGMANVTVSKDLGKIGFVADLMFGPRAEATNYTDKTSLAFIKQLYLTYKPTDKIKFTMGNFMTFVGYELVEATNNFNYSMAYNYTNGPFHHTGLKVDFALSENFGLMVGTFGPTDNKFYSGAPTKMNFGGQLSYVNGGFKAYLNALTGQSHNPFALKESIDTTTSDVTTLDLTVSYQVSSKVGLGLNVINKSAKLSSDKNATSDAFTGIAVYANYAASDKFILAARYENFNDSKNVTGVYDGAAINAFTLSGNIKIDALTITPEIRFDSADKKLSLLGGEKSDFAFILATTYKF
jgi:Putative beta-barrel porin-2, OmpL-like. bbp2